MFKHVGITCLAALQAVWIAPAHAQADESVPDHCAYLYAVASARMTNVVSGLANNLDAHDEIALANEAVQLTRNLNCPIEPLEGAVNCAVQEAKRRDGQPVGIMFVLDCVENSADRKMPVLRRAE